MYRTAAIVVLVMFLGYGLLGQGVSFWAILPFVIMAVGMLSDFDREDRARD